jgi:hypothetical protein
MAPRSHAEWTALLEDVRRYQRRIGFEPTANFHRADEASEGYPRCGHASPFYLPYSYQDPAIRWQDVRTEAECRASVESMDVDFSMIEAVANRGTPVTRNMLVAPFARFVYLVLHEDCHAQFGLPSGIEEALCNALAFAGMDEIAEERFSDAPEEYRSLADFARAGSARADFTLALYEELAALYERHENGLISAETLLSERGEIFRTAEQRLARPEGSLNNVWLATLITYSRHYPLMRRVLDAFDGDLARAVAFFRRLDAARAAQDAVAAKLGQGGEDGIERVRAHEAAIVSAIERALDNETSEADFSGPGSH